MKRKIYQTLLDWKRKDHKKVFLLVDGARRVGKSWIVEAMDLFRQYMIVGGMPQAVAEYVESKDLEEKDGVTYLPLYMTPFL